MNPETAIIWPNYNSSKIESILIEFLKSMPKTCSVQGIIEHRDTGLIDNSGLFNDEFLRVYPFFGLKIGHKDYRRQG